MRRPLYLLGVIPLAFGAAAASASTSAAPSSAVRFPAGFGTPIYVGNARVYTPATAPPSTVPVTSASTTAAPTTPTTPTTPSTTVATTTTTAMRGCVTLPSSCGYPDATNTGPTGTLRRIPEDVTSGVGWHYDSRGWVEVDGNGTVFDGFVLHDNLDVTASNVTISNVRDIVGGDTFGISLRHTKNVTVKDSEVGYTGPASGRLLVGIKDIYGDSTDTQILTSEWYGTSTGIQIDEGLVQGNYVHDLLLTGGDHINGTTSNGGSAQLTIDHNTVLNSYGQTDAISLFEDFGAQTNKTISNNLLAGGGYTIYGGANAGGQQTSNIKIVGNRISRLYFPNGGSFGPLAAFDQNGPGNVFTGNVWDDTGITI